MSLYSYLITEQVSYIQSDNINIRFSSNVVSASRENEFLLALIYWYGTDYFCLRIWLLQIVLLQL